MTQAAMCKQCIHECAWRAFWCITYSLHVVPCGGYDMAMA